MVITAFPSHEICPCFCVRRTLFSPGAPRSQDAKTVLERLTGSLFMSSWRLGPLALLAREPYDRRLIKENFHGTQRRSENIQAVSNQSSAYSALVSAYFAIITYDERPDLEHFHVFRRKTILSLIESSLRVFAGIPFDAVP